jgi:hypothetical protein
MQFKQGVDSTDFARGTSRVGQSDNHGKGEEQTVYQKAISPQGAVLTPEFSESSGFLLS